MPSLTRLIAPSLILISATAALAVEPSPLVEETACLFGGPVEPAAAARDTVILIGPWGSGALVNGQFQTPDGQPAWNGWTHRDATRRTESRWHVDTYHAVAGHYSVWCGEAAFAACNDEDPPGGYGPSYDELLDWRFVVADPGQATQVQISALVNHDTEPAYDYSHLGYEKRDQELAYLWTADGRGEQVPVVAAVEWLPGEYVGDFGDEVRLVWQVTSDGAWDDADCSYPSAGALQVDEITVTVTRPSGTFSTFDDFEDGTLGNWHLSLPQSVGDYTHLRSGLNDLDPCATNLSPQVCFLADDRMLAERGLPTQTCQDWCYGPSGYVLNTEGGAAGPEHYLECELLSPVIPWPGGAYEGAGYVFDVYRHEDLAADSPGIFYAWGIRSTASPDPADIEDAAFQDRDSGHYYGGPDYIRGGEPRAGDLLEAGCRWVQVQILVREHGWLFGWEGDNAKPAPYFDNVRLTAWEWIGPRMSAREFTLAQDAFPADGALHGGAELGLNDVRFDMAHDISPATHRFADAGDSIVIELASLRTGATLVTEDIDATVTAPRLYFLVRTNPLFDAYRLPVGPFTTDCDDPLSVLSGEIASRADGLMSGWVQGAPARANGTESAQSWMFDLPDADFLYPGDLLHYYFEAWEDLAGDHRGSVLPADRSGYEDFDDPLGYDPGFVVRALPTLRDAALDQPRILFWNDFGNRGGRDEWWQALLALGHRPGGDLDVFYTNDPGSGAGNGLGGRASLAQIAGYRTLVYTAGDLACCTITDQDWENDPGDDIGLLEGWLSLGGRSALLAGDKLVSDLWVESGTSATRDFVTTRMGLQWQGYDARPLLGGDLAPRVEVVPGQSVFAAAGAWNAYGSCPGINRFDAVTADPGDMLAVFGDGTAGLAAATRHVAAEGSVVVSLPYDLMFVRGEEFADKAGQPASLPTRALLLEDVLASFGHASGEPATGTSLPGAVFSAGAHPNPFNPSTRIDFHLPRAGRLQLRIFDVRGQLVRTLIDETRPAGEGHALWNGTDESGRGVASGVYFYEARAGQDLKVDKLMLLK